ncbi:MAG: hypothetical protein P1P87_09225, partial [Trueperaceae bacterium]|nr:hypothetical protein [Trueperaceae bacterium]
MNPNPEPTRRTPSRVSLVLAVAALIALLAACGAPAPVSGIEIAPSSASVAVVRGGSADVDVVLTRTGGASGPVALSVSGLPANVAASFAPPSLDGATTTSVLTLTATAAATDGTAALTITADGASLTDTAALTLEVESLSVAGRVVQIFGQPVVAVTAASQGETAFTDANGAFVLDGLSIPYDLALSTAAGSGAVHVFEGLTTTMPVLTPSFALGLGLPTAETAALSGDVLGGAAVGVDRIVAVCAEGLDRVVFGCDYANSGDTTYLLDASWFGPTTTDVRIHALHLEFALDHTPAAFLGYETFDVSLSDGDANVRDLALAPVASVLVEGSLEAAAGMTIASANASVRFGPNLSMLVMQSGAIGGDVALLMPNIAGATYDVMAIANGPDGTSFAWVVDQAGDFGALDVPMPLLQGTPADAAVGVDLTTPFTSTGSDQVRTYFFTGAGPALAVTTSRASVTVPDPALGGFAFPSGAAYS